MARSIEVKIVGDASSLQRAFGQADSAAGRFGSSLTRGVGHGLRMLGSAAIVAGAAVGSGLAAATIIGIKGLVAHEKADKQTAATLKSTGGAAKVTGKHIREYAEELEDLTGIDDVAIQGSENLLLTFTKVRNEVGKGNDIFDKATLAALDMSVALGTDLNSASIMVGKALNDPIKGMTALTRAGVQFTDKQKAKIASLIEEGDLLGAQKLMLEELATQMGGSSAAAGDTLAGKWDKLKNAGEEVAEKLTTKLMPSLHSLADWAIDVVESGSVSEAFGKISDGIKNVASDMAKKAGEIDWSGVATTVGSGLNKAFSVAGDWLSGVDWSKPAGAVRTGLSAAFGGLDFSSVAANVKTGVVGKIKEIDWSGIPEALGGLVAKALNWAATVEWGGLAEKVAGGINKALVAVKWEDLGTALGGMAGGLAKAVVTLDWSALGTAVKDAAAGAIKGAFKAGGDFAESSGFEDAMYDLGYDSASALLEGFGFENKMEDFEAKLNAVGLTFDRVTGKVVVLKNTAPGAATGLGMITTEALELSAENEVLAEKLDGAATAARGLGTGAGVASPKISGMTGKVGELSGAIGEIPDKSVTNVSVPGAVDSKGKADDVTGAVKNIPDSHKTRIDTLGVSGALSSIGAVGAALASLHDKTITVTVWTNNMISSFQHGGVAPGGMAIVGEAGPELVALPRGSRVFSNPESRRMAARHGGGGGDTYVTLNVQGSVMSERDLVQTIRDGLIRGPGSINPSLWGARA